MNNNVSFFKVIGNFLSTLSKPSQDITEQFLMNDSIFNCSQASEKAAVSDEDAVKNMFGLQLSSSVKNNNSNSNNNSSLVQDFSQRAEAAIANASSALEKMKNNSSGDAFAAETQTRIELLNLKDEIDASIATATEEDKPKLMELSKQLGEIESAQTDARVKILEKSLDEADKESAIGDKYYSRVASNIFDKADMAKTKDEIDASTEELLEAKDNYSKAKAEFSLDGNKRIAQERIDTFDQYLEKLDQKMSGLEKEENKEININEEK